MLALGNHHGHHGGHHGGGWGPWGGWVGSYGYPYVDVAPVYVPTQAMSACRWFEDLKTGADGSNYCQAPAVWLIVAGAAITGLVILARKK